MCYLQRHSTACNITVFQTRNPVHQSGYFKLENRKNQVQIDRRSAFRPTSVQEIPNRKSKINFYRAILITLLI